MNDSVKRSTPSAFHPRPTPSGQRRAMTPAEIDAWVKERAEQLRAEAATLTVPVHSYRHLNDPDIVVSATVAVRVNGKFERCKVLDKGQMSHSGVWVYEVRPLDQTHTPTGRARGLSIRRNVDIYPEAVANVGASAVSSDESDDGPGL